MKDHCIQGLAILAQAFACTIGYLGAFALSLSLSLSLLLSLSLSLSLSRFCSHIMSSMNRLQWLALQIHSGQSAFVTFSYNFRTSTEKVKFTLTDDCLGNTTYRPCVMAALSGIQSAMSSSIVCDKGHRSKSSNQTVIEFWIRQIPLSEEVMDESGATRAVDQLTGAPAGTPQNGERGLSVDATDRSSTQQQAAATNNNRQQQETATQHSSQEQQSTTAEASAAITAAAAVYILAAYR